jgi:urease accessory protein
MPWRFLDHRPTDRGDGWCDLKTTPARTWMRVRALWLAAPALVLSGAPVEAHLVTTGLGPVYDGISHFLASPEDLVPVFVLALLAGQCGPETARRVLFALPLAWLVGALAGLAAAAAPPPDLTWLTFILLGGLVAAHIELPGTSVVALASLLGLFREHPRAVGRSVGRRGIPAPCRHPSREVHSGRPAAHRRGR